MLQPDNQDHEREKTMMLRASLVLFAFGLIVLAYLFAIGHPDWFVLRPVSSASAAMSNVAAPNSAVYGIEEIETGSDQQSANNAGSGA